MVLISFGLHRGPNCNIKCLTKFGKGNYKMELKGYDKECIEYEEALIQVISPDVSP
jgi:hypothetical protein